MSPLVIVYSNNLMDFVLEKIAFDSARKMENPKIVVLTGDLSYAVRRGILRINQAIPDISWLIVIHSPVKTFKVLLKNQWRNLCRNGLRWIPYQLGEIFKLVFSIKLEPLTITDPGYYYSQEAFQSYPNITILTVPDIHGADTLEAIQTFSPNLGISLAAPILKKALFSIPKLGTLNLHKGKLPDFRGMPPAFWELWNDIDLVGCSVHWVDEKLDSGAVVKEHTIQKQPFSNLKGLQLSLDEVGCDLMSSAVKAVLENTAQAVPQTAGGKTYRKPTLEQINSLNRKMQAKLALPGSLLRYLKDSIFFTRVCYQRWLPVSLKKPKIVVLLYHRVSDDTRDNLTVGIEQFDRQMALLRRHYHVLSIHELIHDSNIKVSAKPMVCVTFDDGYLDNYENAVPVLLKHGIPAAFFVSTGIIDRGDVFPHDIRRQNPKLPVMTWQQLRIMRDEGFTIGSHSVNHIDCASEAEETVRSELTQSLMDVRQELGLQEVMFAYPYGGRHHMTPQRLQLVKEAGYTACLSAYGGVNINTIDRFNIVRSGIHYEFSDWAFRNRCEGY